jgi:hypothetical protein
VNVVWLGKFFTNHTVMIIRLIQRILNRFSVKAIEDGLPTTISKTIKEELAPQNGIVDRIEIDCKGNYWWDDSNNVTTPLRELFNKILSEIRIDKITIRGTDFDDGFQSRSAVITVESNRETQKTKVTVKSNI